MSGKMKVKRMERNSGITLVALVVSIMVIIILATVSINAVLGENGIIKKAQLAKDMQANSVAAEGEAMDTLLEEYANMMAEPETPTGPVVTIGRNASNINER